MELEVPQPTITMVENVPTPSNSDKVSVVQMDITKLRSDCIVNAAKCTLSGGGAVDGAIHDAAGPELVDYCVQTYGKCDVGQAVITPSFKLSEHSVKYIIHTVGPQDGDSTKLANCYRNSLNFLINHQDIRSIAFPCIATLNYRFKKKPAAHIALNTVKDWLKTNNTHVDKIIFCCYEDEDLEIYNELVTDYFPDYLPN